MKKIFKTGCWFKIRKDNYTRLPLALTKILGVKVGDAIEVCLGDGNEIVLKKYIEEDLM